MNTQLTTYHQNRPIAMAGFFSWLGKAVKAVARSVVNVITGQNGGLWGVIEDFTNGDGQFGGENLGGWSFGQNAISSFIGRQSNQDYPLSQTEETILDNWVEQNFIPFFRAKLEAIKTANDYGLSVNEFVELYNSIHQTIGFFKWLHQYSLSQSQQSFGALSQNAINARGSLVDLKMELLKEQLDAYMQNKQISVTAVKRTFDVSSFDYGNLGFLLPQSIRISAYQVDGENDITESSNTTSNNGNDAVNTSSPGTTIEGKPNYLAYGIAAVALGVLYKSFNKNKKR